MSHDVTSHDQSGGITAGEVSGSTGSEEVSEDDGGEKWTQTFYWVAGGLSAIAAIIGLILKVAGVI
jgi:hypothetical protein